MQVDTCGLAEANIISESRQISGVLAPITREPPPLSLSLSVPSNWLTSIRVPSPISGWGLNRRWMHFGLRPASSADVDRSRPRFKKSLQFARIRHRQTGRPAADLSQPSGSDTTDTTMTTTATTISTEEPTTDLASFPPDPRPQLEPPVVASVVVSGGVGSPGSRDGRTDGRTE